MAALHDFVRLEDAGLNVFAVEIFVWIGGHRAVGREVAALAAQNELLSREPLLRKLRQRRTDATLAALETIIDGRIDHIDAALDRGHYRSGIAGGRVIIRLAKVGANAERGDLELLCFAKMTWLGVRESLDVTRSALCCGRFAHIAPYDAGGAGALPASFSDFGASSREQPRMI